MPRFVPVADQEKPRSEQDEESLRKHRQFDTPFAQLPKDLNDPRQKKEDMNPMGRQSDDLEQDEHGLWKKKAALFEKQKTWGRETMEYSNPELARADGNKGPQWGRPGTVGWGVRGSFGGRTEDKGDGVLQRGEVNQTLVKNDKGLWVRKKVAGEDEPLEPARKNMWRCPKCKKETALGLEFCGNCDARRPANVAAASSTGMLRSTKAGEDPRMEAAGNKSRGTADAAKQALKALEERRKRQTEVMEDMGLSKRSAPSMRHEGYRTVQQVKPASRVKHNSKWQGVQRTDEEAQRIVGKALGGDTEARSAPKRLDDGGTGSLAAVRKKEKGPDVYDDIDDAIKRADRSRSRSPLGKNEETGEVVVDFF
eukprot:TRINITY_DN101864_c0_g1_i1.p1 TRINITY_DN101864_c0_g1~~TRINITY_DN101864_c0_g1_i1.p1  ORF type:complete len:367 (-),score=102.98 TRINITY_DN101864_c0_g1_i1:54-1154(-)